MRRLPLFLASALVAGAALTGVTGASQADSASSGSIPTNARLNVRGQFNLATFNVLGSRHTDGHRGKRGFANSAKRMRSTVKAFRKQNLHVVALQEFEEKQWRAFRRLTNGNYRVWADEKQIANAVAWRTDKFAFVRARTIRVPYFHGNIQRMPVVFLRHRGSGQTMAFTSFHNPASNKKRTDSARWRKKATTREIRLMRNLRERGHVAFLAGDFNDRTKKWHCRVARATNMVTAGSGDRRGGSCKSLDRMRIDWIFGSNGVRFSRYAAIETRLVNRASDHPLVVTRVR